MLQALAVGAALVLGGAAQFGPPPSSAQIGPIFDPADATELAATLAEATEVQGICYGWRVDVTNQGTGTSSVDLGSSNGVGVAAWTCPKWIEFSARITYTSDYSEAEDSATWDVDSNLEPAPTAADLRRIGISSDRLLSEQDDLAVIEATSALPLLAAERGLAPPVPLEANTEALPPGDGATGRPGSDWTRTNGGVVGLGVLLLVLGAAWTLYAVKRPNRAIISTKGVSHE